MPTGIYKRTEQHKRNLSKSIKRALKNPATKAKMTGRPCSQETRRKIGEANAIRRKGKKLSEKTRRNMSIAKKKQWAELKNNSKQLALRNKAVSKSLKGKYVGELAANWRGGISREKRSGHLSSAWKDAVIKRDNYTCQVCNKYGGDLHVDHINSWADFPELRFETSNGRTLCVPCHYYITFRRKMPANSRWGMRKALQVIKNLS